jgi:hypothetical protein
MAHIRLWHLADITTDIGPKPLTPHSEALDPVPIPRKPCCNGYDLQSLGTGMSNCVVGSDGGGTPLGVVTEHGVEGYDHLAHHRCPVAIGGKADIIGSL